MLAHSLEKQLLITLRVGDGELLEEKFELALDGDVSVSPKMPFERKLLLPGQAKGTVDDVFDYDGFALDGNHMDVHGSFFVLDRSHMDIRNSFTRAGNHGNVHERRF